MLSFSVLYMYNHHYILQSLSCVVNRPMVEFRVVRGTVPLTLLLMSKRTVPMTTCFLRNLSCQKNRPHDTPSTLENREAPSLSERNREDPKRKGVQIAKFTSFYPKNTPGMLSISCAYRSVLSRNTSSETWVVKRTVPLTHSRNLSCQKNRPHDTRNLSCQKNRPLDTQSP